MQFFKVMLETYKKNYSPTILIGLKLLILAFSVLAISSCSVKTKLKVEKNMPALEETEQVLIYGLKNDPPSDAVYVGTLENGGMNYYDNRAVNPCDYFHVTSALRTKARKAGANLIKIDEIDYASKCLKFKTRIFHVENAKQTLEDHYTNRYVTQDSNFAIVHFMRPLGQIMQFADADIYDETGERINYVVTGFVYHHKVTEEGPTTFKLEDDKENVILDIKKGNEYFILIHVESKNWLNSKFKMTDVSNPENLELNRLLMIEMISKYPKTK